jgi:hypothetical protein
LRQADREKAQESLKSRARPCARRHQSLCSPAAQSRNKDDSLSAERGRALEDQQQQTALKTYQDYMLELLLNKNLLSSPTGSDVREMARARTLTALRRVGGSRKRVPEVAMPLI